jgi:hypothetical protein
MEERRWFPRYPVSWPIRLGVSERFALAGRATDASTHGMRVVLLNWIPSDILKVGAPYRLEVYPGTQSRFACVAEVRNVTDRGVGLQLEIPLGLPDALMLVAQEGPRRAAEALTVLVGLVIGALGGLSDVARPSIGERLEVLALTAVREGARADWNALRRTLSELAVLLRFLQRLEELPAAECRAIQAALREARELLLACVW